MTLDLKLLKGKITDILAEMEAISNEIEKAPDEKGKTDGLAKYKGKVAEYEKLKSNVDEAKAHGERRKQLADVDELIKVEPQGKTLSFDRSPAQARDHEREARDHYVIFTEYFKGKTLDSFSGNARQVLSPKGSWRLDSAGAIDGAVALPKSVAAAVLPEAFFGGKSDYNTAFLTPGGSRGMYAGKALPMTSGGAAGEGNLFQPDFMKNLLQYPSEPPALWPLCYKVPCSYGTILWPQLVQGAPGAEGSATEFAEEGFAASYWTAEGAEINGTEPQFKQQSIPTFELGTRTELSRQFVNRSTIPVEQLIDQLFRRSIMGKIDRAVIGGDGVTKPSGVLPFASLVARAGAGHVTYDDFVDLEHTLAPQLRPGAVYAIQDKALQDVKLKKDSQGRPLFIPFTSGAGVGANLGTINGYPVVPTQRLPALGVAGDLLFGNFGQYVAPVEQEIILARSADRKIEQNVMVYVMFIQVGGKPVETRAFAQLNA
jgi:HK97 family phage major capsid protein